MKELSQLSRVGTRKSLDYESIYFNLTSIETVSADASERIIPNEKLHLFEDAFKLEGSHAFHPFTISFCETASWSKKDEKNQIKKNC